MKKFILYLTLSVFTSLSQSQTQYPPVSPKWVFEPWVWEDATNTDDSTLALINGYLIRDIPVGAVIIDSPWETDYNTFVFDNGRYKHPEVLINDSLKNKGIHVILWITGVIDSCCSLYESAKSNGYFINNGDRTDWWKGCGRASHIDFFNPAAVVYWEGLMDSVFNNYEVDGWKVDETDSYLNDQILTYDGIKTKREYSDAYYSEIYNYTHIKRGNNGMITARPFYNQRWYAPISVNTAGWVGDQINSWEGLLNALNNIFISARMGYAAVGSDIGGYYTEDIAIQDKTLFLRWAQFGALVPIMENGGTSDSCHKPWLFDENTVEIYKYFANLHHELVPYLYSYDIAAHLTATSILRPFGTNSPDPNIWTDPDGPWRYLLGDNFFVSAIYQDSYSRQITFPEGSWINYWNEDDIHHGGTAQLNYSLDQYPLFICSGSIIPMNVDDSITGHGSGFSKNYLTLLIYPDGSSSYRYYTDESTSTEIKCNEGSSGFTISFSENTDSVIIRLKNKIEPGNIKLNGNINLAKKNSFSDFEGSSSGWFHGKMSDDKNVYTWIKFSNPADTLYVTTDCALDIHPVNYELSILNEGEGNEYYIDRVYIPITIPEKYKGFYLIKTANGNKATTNLDLNFNICSSADVYIAYDHRISTPSWITDNYINTGEKIYVTDTNLEYFNIWKRTTQPGVITFGDNEGNSESSMYFVFYQLHGALNVNVKVFLQGPYAGGDTMHTTLWQNNLIPKSQPYNILPWNYNGTESVSTIPPGAVDWVLVELRTGTTSFTRAAFIKSDGTLADLDGTSPVRFSEISPGTYYIVIKHRNHLAVMSASPVILPNSSAYDFTTSSDKYYGSTEGAVKLETNVWGMIAGDANGNGQIQNNDSEDIWKPANGISGYKNADYNMNGEVQNNDNENYWKVNNGRGSQVPNL
jgi:Glycosyl hydrolases family 31 TIM-barrel domain/Glycosyl hydrolase family 31 C-terminal domain